MNFFDLIAGFSTAPFGSAVRYGIAIDELPDSEAPEPQNLSTIFTCCKILSDNFSRLPFKVRLNGQETTHQIIDRMVHAPNDYQNAQTFWSTVEWHRNTFGNGFVRMFPDRWEIIDPALIVDYKWKNGKLFYTVNYALDIRGRKAHPKSEDIPASQVLHFRQMSHDGVMGLSPLTAAAANTRIMQNATRTVNNFYKNRAVSPLAIESIVESAQSYKAMQADRESFMAQYSGVQNVGKPITLPANTKLVPLAIHFADAELIATMKFTRDELTSMYGIPNYMVSENDSQQNDIEQQSTQFKQMTIAPIAEVYSREIEFKCFTLDERKAGYKVAPDLDAMVEVLLEKKINSYQKAVSNGLMTPNEATIRLGNAPIPSEHGDKHYMQAQYVPLEDYEKYNPLLKNDPTLKTNSDENKSVSE